MRDCDITRRELFAAMIMSNPYNGPTAAYPAPKTIEEHGEARAKYAVMMADALIRELDK